MEADWSIEIGSDSPVIDCSWETFVDLRGSRDAINSVIEAVQRPALRAVLLALNNETSPVFTTKCDIWTLAEQEIDADEFGARREDAHAGFASYIDILEREPTRFVSFAFHDQYARALTDRLRGVELPQGRVDVVVRSAVSNNNRGYGLTLYAAGCGCDEAGALAAWEAVLGAAVAATMAQAAYIPPAGE